MTRVVALRHGETAWNREGRMQGWAPVPLNDRGREQATAAGEWLADEYAFDAVYSSDLLRTRETTERVLEHLPYKGSGRKVTYEAAWRERDIGVYQGLSYQDVYERFPEFGLGEAAAEAARRVPDSGESLADVYERATERFEAVVAGHDDDDTVLVVSHGGPIYMLTGHAKAMDIRDAVLDHSQDNCGATVFDCSEGVEVVAENVTEWDG
ncbi:histidine phosphatase family protein [Halosegnis marinus]|uniref:Histidine phosphatase family protein n=1 Tax=Halosegnis marinus TaxID=3034023 RepID=A0ABD5ZN89_9EURY|nr:histidine phosphatase family protein [Halosegnis sp. DT85]